MDDALDVLHVVEGTATAAITLPFLVEQRVLFDKLRAMIGEALVLQQPFWNGTSILGVHLLADPEGHR